MTFETREGAIELRTTLWVVWDHRILLVKLTDVPRRRRAWELPSVPLRFGEHPHDVANRLLNELGASAASLGHTEVDSAVVESAWRVGIHVRASVEADVTPGPDFARHGWFGADELPPAERFAGGHWERMLAARGVRAVVHEP